MDDKMVEWLFQHPISDGGQFTGISDIIPKIRNYHPIHD